MTNESDNDKESYGESSNSEEEDDPRIVAMFQNAAGSQDEDKTTTTTRRRELHISEHSILDCFQRALESHDCKDPGANGVWKSPSLFQMDDETEEQDGQAAVSVADWIPASSSLPAWVVRPPAEMTSPSNN
eukprot:scaffold8374_cov175-Amphora_coffeaeformis.AAC.80